MIIYSSVFILQIFSIQLKIRLEILGIPTWNHRCLISKIWRIYLFFLLNIVQALVLALALTESTRRSEILFHFTQKSTNSDIWLIYFYLNMHGAWSMSWCYNSTQQQLLKVSKSIQSVLLIPKRITYFAFLSYCLDFALTIEFLRGNPI